MTFELMHAAAKSEPAPWRLAEHLHPQPHSGEWSMKICGYIGPEENDKASPDDVYGFITGADGTVGF
jgi:hypothetical protein